MKTTHLIILAAGAAGVLAGLLLVLRAPRGEAPKVARAPEEGMTAEDQAALTELGQMLDPI
jgi:hypothetical protein